MCSEMCRRDSGEPTGEHAAFLLVGQQDVDAQVLSDRQAVSYTHLTLPTIYTV